MQRNDSTSLTLERGTSCCIVLVTLVTDMAFSSLKLFLMNRSAPSVKYGTPPRCNTLAAVCRVLFPPTSSSEVDTKKRNKIMNVMKKTTTPPIKNILCSILILSFKFPKNSSYSKMFVSRGKKIRQSSGENGNLLPAKNIQHSLFVRICRLQCQILIFHRSWSRKKLNQKRF